MRKSSIIVFMAAALLLTALALFTAGCEPEEEEAFDERALVAVSNYVQEMTRALLDDTMIADLQGWVRDYYHEEDDLPLEYDEERREWLLEHRDRLQSLREQHLSDDFPTREEIAGWEVVIVRGDKEWLLEGEIVNEALDKLDALYLETTGVIEMIEEEEGELDFDQSERVLDLIDGIEPVVDEVREVFFRQ